MKKPILLLTLLFSVNAFAESAPDWWKDSTCRQTMNRDFLLMVANGYSRAKAKERTENNFKTCICSSGDEAKIAVNSLLDGHEIEMISADGDRVLSVPIKYGRDFVIMFVGTQCYLNVGKPELCNNAGFMSEARQSFRVFEIYDAKRDLCVMDIDNKFFKGE